MQPETIIAHGASRRTFPMPSGCTLYLNPNFVDLVEQIDACRRHPDHRRHHRDRRFARPPIWPTTTPRPNAPASTCRGISRRTSSTSWPPTTSRSARSGGRTSPSLFADIVGFTAYTEDHQPEQVFEMLREFHRRMEQVVFENQGNGRQLYRRLHHGDVRRAARRAGRRGARAEGRARDDRLRSTTGTASAAPPA